MWTCVGIDVYICNDFVGCSYGSLFIAWIDHLPFYDAHYLSVLFKVLVHFSLPNIAGFTNPSNPSNFNQFSQDPRMLCAEVVVAGLTNDVEVTNAKYNRK